MVRENSERYLRTSIERRRIWNAKNTALRQRKWKEVRLQHEQREQREAREILERRRIERARLAAYIYSAIQISDQGSSNRLPSICQRDKETEIKLRSKACTRWKGHSLSVLEKKQTPLSDLVVTSESLPPGGMGSNGSLKLCQVSSNEQSKVDLENLHAAPESVKSEVIDSTKKRLLSKGTFMRGAENYALTKPSGKSDKGEEFLSFSKKSCFLKPASHSDSPCGKGSYRQHILPRSSFTSNQKGKLALCHLKGKKKLSSGRLFGLSDEEKIILASIERLDLKLATVSMKSECSQLSLMTEEHQSTESAPTIMGRLSCFQKKTAAPVGRVPSDSIPLPLRPKASQARTLPVSFKQRQNERCSQNLHAWCSLPD